MNEPLKLVKGPNTVLLGPQRPPSALELVSEAADLAVGAGMLTFILAPFALPGLVLIALTTVALLIPALGVALVLAPLAVARRWWRSRDRSPGATRPARSGVGDAGYETMRHQLVARGGPGA